MHRRVVARARHLYLRDRTPLGSPEVVGGEGSIDAVAQQVEAGQVTREEYDSLLMVRKCADTGGPVNVTQTVAKIDVCGRCGYTVALHTQWRGRVLDPPPLPQPGPGRLGLG